ncbi:Peptidase M10, metallopeptidase [Corchorus olitorius]|uniref:Peptidase M10, metallopeptidase n=1 Tax=Corchorus olitorius TaxID=93759 RepID=A0A1R3FUP8_9ROSI|nr:Peptidase M10, metallopeptidase [Corchorus olitorius]
MLQMEQVRSQKATRRCVENHKLSEGRRGSALSVSKKVQLKNNPTQPDSVLNLFKNHGFSHTQIRKIVERMPKLLLCNAEKTLLPKFQFFYSKGIPSSDLSVVLSSNPKVLHCNIDNCIIPNFNYFKDFTHCDDSEVILAYKGCSAILAENFQSIVAPNVALLREHGVPDSHIMTELVRHPRNFILNHDKFRRSVEEVEKLGFNPLKSHFLEALQVLVQISKSTWERKLNVFKEWGWSDEDFVIAFEKYPRCMMLSEDKIIKPRKEDNSKVFSASSSVIQRFYQETTNTEWEVACCTMMLMNIGALILVPNEIDLESVTVHEIGHLLGLQHSLVMYAYFDSGITKRKLSRDDVHGIRALYGLL